MREALEVGVSMAHGRDTEGEQPTGVDDSRWK